MKIKKKLFLGFGLLFVVVLFFGAVSIYYIEEMSVTSKVALKNNYETLIFTREMRSVLDENDLPFSAPAAQKFDISLKKQENNITEPGEKEATAGVRKNFGLLIDPKKDLVQKQVALKNMRYFLKTIDGLNLKAIVDKDNYTHKTVDSATIYLGAMVFITFLILFILIASFPGFIVNPLSQFADGLLEISQKNYGARLDLKTSEEFANLSAAFNTMAERLSAEQNNSLTRILAEEVRISALIEEKPDIIIGINEKDEVLFMNNAAKNILNLNDTMVVGKNVKELKKDSSLLEIILENQDLDNPLKVDFDGKSSYFQQKGIEIVVPNLKLNASYAVQYSGFAAGIIYLLKEVPEPKLVSSE